MGSALSYLKCQDNALDVYSAVASAVGAESLQTPKYPVCTLVSSAVGMWICCNMVWKTAAGSGDKLGSESSAGLGCSSQSFAPASSAWFWDAALSPLWIKACCLSLVHTSVWYQRREEEGSVG